MYKIILLIIAPFLVLLAAYPFIRKKNKNTDRFIAESLLQKHGISNIEVQEIRFETGTNECGTPVGLFFGTFVSKDTEELHYFDIVRDATPDRKSVV